MGAPNLKAVSEAAPQSSVPHKKSEDSQIFDLKVEPNDFGQPGSLRYIVLQSVLEEKYDTALEEIKGFSERSFEFPNFIPRCQRYLNHSKDLVYAIKAKRNFDGINSLTRAKQQELREKFKEHYNELKFILKKIEKIEADLRIEDARSTIYIIRALWLAAVALIAVWFLLEVAGGLAITGAVVAEDGLDKVGNWIFNLIGW